MAQQKMMPNSVKQFSHRAPWRCGSLMARLRESINPLFSTLDFDGRKTNVE